MKFVQRKVGFEMPSSSLEVSWAYRHVGDGSESIKTELYETNEDELGRVLNGYIQLSNLRTYGVDKGVFTREFRKFLEKIGVDPEFI